MGIGSDMSRVNHELGRYEVVSAPLILISVRFLMQLHTYRTEQQQLLEKVLLQSLILLYTYMSLH